MRRVAAWCAAGACALAASACGTPSPDLFVVKRDGVVPGAKLELLVSDTSARCNHGAVKPLSSAQTLEARDITGELLKVQSGEVSLPDEPQYKIFSFVVQTERGSLSYPDTAQRPPVLPRLSRFVRRVAIDTCGLQR
ncbi:MAG: hypothetical protein QOK16_1889 [Solirubrobacteraceae bacterium]|nr:hypothetical protein [Solirubrobacteraceae bacterium]